MKFLLVLVAAAAVLLAVVPPAAESRAVRTRDASPNKLHGLLHRVAREPLRGKRAARAAADASECPSALECNRINDLKQAVTNLLEAVQCQGPDTSSYESNYETPTPAKPTTEEPTTKSGASLSSYVPILSDVSQISSSLLDMGIVDSDYKWSS